MPRALEFHDSVFTSARQDGADLLLHIVGYIHESEGNPGHDAGTGSTQAIEVVLKNAKREGTLKEGAKLGDGALQLGGVLYEGLVPLPPEGAGRAKLTLHSGSEELVVSADAIELKPVGEAKLVDKFNFGPGKRP